MQRMMRGPSWLTNNVLLRRTVLLLPALAILGIGALGIHLDWNEYLILEIGIAQGIAATCIYYEADRVGVW